MTERTRWDALTEELELKDESTDPRVEPEDQTTDEAPYTRYARVSPAGGKAAWDKLRAYAENHDQLPQPTTQTLVMVIIEGRAVGPVTDVVMAWEQAINVVGPPRVSGSFYIPATCPVLIDGRDGLLALIRDDGNLYFSIHVTATTRVGGDATEATLKVEFVGTQAG